MTIGRHLVTDCRAQDRIILDQQHGHRRLTLSMLVAPLKVSGPLDNEELLQSDVTGRTQFGPRQNTLQQGAITDLWVRRISFELPAYGKLKRYLASRKAAVSLILDRYKHSEESRR